jgi:hypothetical protein
MTDQRCDHITATRLLDWRKRLTAEHATPAVLLGIGHDHASGKLVICTPEDMSDDDLLTLIEGILTNLKAGKAVRSR